MTLFRGDDEDERKEPRWLVFVALCVVVPILAAWVAGLTYGGWLLLVRIACG